MSWKDITNFYYKNNFKLITSYTEYRKKDHLLNPVHYQLLYFLDRWYGSGNSYKELCKNFSDYIIENKKFRVLFYSLPI